MFDLKKILFNFFFLAKINFNIYNNFLAFHQFFDNMELRVLEFCIA